MRKASLKTIGAVDAGGLFVAGAVLVIGGLLRLVSSIGFYDALRDAHPAMILLPIVGVVGIVFVTISHALPLALAVSSCRAARRQRALRELSPAGTVSAGEESPWGRRPPSPCCGGGTRMPDSATR